ncbi:MAG: CDP-glycerol glycerophosphotransferase [Chitinivibrionales bacterium]|nr:CDP-glycerol glycerophosphotransferase [Chitinivibrionales bacterium]
MTRVLFEVTQDYYWPSMEPIYQAMEADSSYELRIRVGRNHRRFAGVFLIPQQRAIERLHEAKGYRTTRSAAGFDVVIAGDAIKDGAQYGGALLCDVDHGPGFKTLRYRNFAACADTPQVVFVEGRYRLEKFRKYGLDTIHTVIDVGLPKLDPLLQGRYSRDEILSRYGLDPSRPTVVYAPSYKPTSIFLIGEAFVPLLDSYNVIVKLHPYSWNGKYAPHRQHRLFERLAAKHPALKLVPPSDHNMLPYLAAADTLVSEGSSVINEFLALGRCGVIVDLPDERLRHHDGQPLLEERTAEWLRDSFVHISSREELRAAVETALNPGAERRRHIERDRDYLFTHTDGQSAHRVKKTIERLLAERPKAAAKKAS